MSHFARLCALLRPVAGVDEIQVVGSLSPAIASQMAWQREHFGVWVHPGAIEHILRQRRDRDEVEFVLRHMPAAIMRPHLYGPDPTDHRRIVVVRRIEDHRAVCVALKRVPAEAAASSVDEIWVSTAYPMGRRTLTRSRWLSTLQESEDETEY